jgi:hypothetical protein
MPTYRCTIEMSEGTDSLGTAYVSGRVLNTTTGAELFNVTGPEYDRVHQQCVDWWDAHGPASQPSGLSTQGAGHLLTAALPQPVLEALIVLMDEQPERLYDGLCAAYSQQYPEAAVALFAGPVDPRGATTRPRPLRP